MTKSLVRKTKTQVELISMNNDRKLEAEPVLYMTNTRKRNTHGRAENGKRQRQDEDLSIRGRQVVVSNCCYLEVCAKLRQKYCDA